MATCERALGQTMSFGSKDAMNQPFDPATFTVPTLGDVQIHHKPYRFFEWFARLTTADGAEVFRAMLREQGRRSVEDAPIDSDHVARLDASAQEACAAAFLAATGAASSHAGYEIRLRPIPAAYANAPLARPKTSAHGPMKANSKTSRVGLSPSFLALPQNQTSLNRLNKMIAGSPPTS